MQDSIEDKAQEVLGYRFHDPALLREALTHASSADSRLQSNERMEFLGDAILGAVVCIHLYHEFPSLHEGEMTKIKSVVVSRRACALVSRQTGLADMLNLGKGMSGRKELPGSVAAAVLESVIAALYLDGGIEPARAFILRHLAPVIRETAESTHQQNFKSVLQQLAQKKETCDVPVYTLLNQRGPDHAKSFEVRVEMDGRRFPARWANSKKQAEQKAALAALEALGVVHVEEAG